METVVLLSQQKADDYLEVEIDLDELDATSAETKATYEEIKKYVAEHNEDEGIQPLILRRLRKKCGIELGQNFNCLNLRMLSNHSVQRIRKKRLGNAMKHFKMM